MLGDAVFLKLDVIVTAEELLIVAGSVHGRIEAAVEKVPRYLTRGASRERDQTIAVLLKQLAVYAGLVVVALEV